MNGKNNALVFLDTLRGFAALYVMVGHARWLLWEGYSEGYVKHPNIYSFLGKLGVYFFSFFKFGHHAVLFFFVLSGFVIHLKQSFGIQAGNFVFDYKGYFLKRITRIYPPFITCMLLTFILDSIGSRLGFSIYSQGTPNVLINQNILSDLSLNNLLGNLLFLKTSTIGIWGSNGPLWSLKYEWWFYMLYPVLLMFNYKLGWVKTFALILALFFVSFYVNFLKADFIVSVAQYLLSWWLGVVLADIYTGRIKVNHRHLGIYFCIVQLSMIYFSDLNNNAVLLDTFWALNFFALLYILFALQDNGFSFAILSKFKWLGNCSYTLYVTHFPILVFFNGILLHFNHNNMPIAQYYIVIVCMICLIIAYKPTFRTLIFNFKELDFNEKSPFHSEKLSQSVFFNKICFKKSKLRF